VRLELPVALEKLNRFADEENLLGDRGGNVARQKIDLERELLLADVAVNQTFVVEV